jgi:hypothetical protein
MKAGTAFVLKDKAVDDHLWIVLSDPELDAEQVLIVSITSLTPVKEQTCLVVPEDHSWVRRASCVAYNFARVVSLETLYRFKDAGMLELQDAISPQLLSRIRERSVESTGLKVDHFDILVAQGLVTE